jgi:1,4-dihydroxy-2-naphthoate octaprenyltransferase
MKDFLILATSMSPILVYFFTWAGKVWKNTGNANFRNTMRMNLIASLCTSLGFIILTIARHFE